VNIRGKAGVGDRAARSVLEAEQRKIEARPQGLFKPMVG
jgi:hypothetical protein